MMIPCHFEQRNSFWMPWDTRYQFLNIDEFGQFLTKGLSWRVQTDLIRNKSIHELCIDEISNFVYSPLPHLPCMGGHANLMPRPFLNASFNLILCMHATRKRASLSRREFPFYFPDRPFFQVAWSKKNLVGYTGVRTFLNTCWSPNLWLKCVLQMFFFNFYISNKGN